MDEPKQRNKKIAKQKKISKDNMYSNKHVRMKEYIVNKLRNDNNSKF